MSTAQSVKSHPAITQAQDKANYYVSQLDKELTKYPAFNQLEERTQIPKAYAFLGGVSLLALLHSINTFASPVSNLLGWALPAYYSVKAIESPSPNDDVQWLTYWVVFGFFTFLESFALRVLLYYFPWYFAFKTLFITWLHLPAFRGAETIYGSVVKPIFANVSAKANSTTTTTSTYPETVSADTLRERTAYATTQ